MVDGGASKTYQDTALSVVENTNLDDNTGHAIRKRVWGILNRSEQECRNQCECDNLEEVWQIPISM